MTFMLLVVLGLFLTFAAFALDLGNMYLWRMRLDKAARAGSLAALGFRGVKGWYDVQPGTSGNTELINATKQAVQDNLSAYGISLNADNIQVTYYPDTDSVGVEVRHTPSTILIGKLNNILNYGFNAPVDPNGNPIGQSRTLNLSRQHQANLNRANVVLMIDVSGSMLCPAPGHDPPAFPDPCSCRRANACGGAITKLDKLADGVESFAKHFNPNQDRISVIAFNLAARQLYSFSNGELLEDATSTHPLLAGTSAYQFLTNEKGNLRPILASLAGSNTNHCDALAEGIRELEGLRTALNVPEPPTRLQPFIVFFTDGAPNAMRGIFAEGDIPNGQCDTYTDGLNSGTGTATRSPTGSCGTRDFYHYALEWTALEGTPSKQYLYRGPGPFVARELDAQGVPRLFKHAIAGNQVAPNGSKTCGIEVPDGDPRKFEQTITRNISGGPGGRGNRDEGSKPPGSPKMGCLSPSTTTFSFSIPYTNPYPNGGSPGPYLATVSGVPISTDNTTWIDPNWPPSFFSLPALTQGYGLQKYDELPYYCALEAADYLRTRFATTIFTVGLGSADAHTTNKTASNEYTQDTTCNDPLQDADDHTSRKDFFLARLAFARSMFTNQLLPTAVRSHYQIAGNQTARDVSSCFSHRLDTGTNPPQPRIGYTSKDGLADGNTTYQDLRPFRPTEMDSIFSGGGGARRLETQGEYFPTDNANEIPRIFDLIAKTILLRSAS